MLSILKGFFLPLAVLDMLFKIHPSSKESHFYQILFEFGQYYFMVLIVYTIMSAV